MKFIPLYFRDRLTVINPQGVIGVVTLWSKPDYVIERFREAGVDLEPATSPIAVFGTLYGNGLREMLRNLLFNPQIQTLLICGHDRSGSRQELVNFFDLGIEPVESSLVRYRRPLGFDPVSTCRIRNTKRLIDDLVRPEQFGKPPQLIILGDPGEEQTIARVKDFFAFLGELIPEQKIEITKAEGVGSEEAVGIPRVIQIIKPKGIPSGGALGIPIVSHGPIIPLPEVELTHFPSNPRTHQVVRDTPLEAWKEVLYLLTRFGRRVTLKKGERLELQHVKVVVEKPRFEAEEKLLACHLDPARLRRYQEDLLKGELRPDETYHYGHRLRSHFGLDTLAACAVRLKEDPEDRKAYVALWDSSSDLTGAEGRPCLVSLFFRKFDDKLTLSATFRTHNALDAWLLNVYGLMAIQEWVAARARLKPGALTVVSHSLGLDPRELDRALTVIGKRPFKIHTDPMGYFRVTVDEGEILVEHRFEDVTLKEYRGKKAVHLQHQIARDLALSDINHAIYLGRQLAKAEMALKEGRAFMQD
jgi:thymidylate synthase